MIKIYFDDVLIDDDGYANLENDYYLFDNSFKLGSVGSNEFKLQVQKELVTELPTNVKIDDDTTKFDLVVDRVEEDNNFYHLTLTDKLINFNFRYDASPLIAENLENGVATYLQDIFEDLCLQAGVETEYILQNENIEVDWYDNRVLAREYLSYIAELEGGYAQILENGKLDILQQNKPSVASYSSEEVSEIVLIEEFTVTTTVYDNGIETYQFSEEQDGLTVYINPDNVFVVNENQIEFVHDSIKGFSFWSLEVPNAPIDSSIRAGEVITFTHESESYDTIAQYSTSYGGKWVGGYFTTLDSQKQLETAVIGVEDKVRTIRTIQNRTEAELSIIAEEVGSNSSQIATLTQSVDGFSEEIEKIDGIESALTIIQGGLDGLSVSVETSGGSNLIKNSVGFYDSDWSDYHTSVTNTEIKQETISGNAWELDNLLAEQGVSIPNGNYTLSFRYKKLLVPATVKIIVTTNEPNEIELTETSWTNGSFPINVTNNSFKVGIYADNAGSAWLSDLVVAVGELSPVWTPAIGESINGGVKIGGGKVELTSGQSNLMQVIDNTGNRIIDTQTNEVVTEYTVDGVNTKGIKAPRGEIADVLIMSLSNQTTFTRL